MAFNITAFVLGLPDNYDSLEPSARRPYLENLPGFVNATQEQQDYVADRQEGWFWQEAFLHTNTSATFWDLITINVTTTDGTSLAPPPSTTPYDCTDSVLMGEWQFLLGSLLCAGIILILLSFLKTRKRLWPEFCWFRPAVVYPVDFITDHDRRWAYTAIFTLLAYRTMKLFDGKEYLELEFVKQYAFLSVLSKLLNILLVGLSFFPFLSCVGLRNYILANIAGILYLTPWVVDACMTGWQSYPRCLDLDDDSFAEGVTEVIAEIPQYIVFIILFVSYSRDLYLNIKKLLNRKEKVDSTSMILPPRPEEEEFYFKYVRHLMERKPKPPPENFFQKIKQRFTYESIPGYKYSPRIACTMVCAAFFVFYLVTRAISTMESALSKFNAALTEDNAEFLVIAYSFITAEVYEDNVLQRARRLMDVIRASVMLGLVLSAIVQVIFMVRTTVNYRLHLAKLMRGVHTFHYKKYQNGSPSSILLSQLRYSGYQIAFIAYGFSILAALIIIISLVLGFFFFMPLIDRSTSLLIEFLKGFWPNILVAIFIYILQRLLCHFAFLQERGKYLALNNRRVYHVVSFFMFLFNVILGIFSCLKRIAYSMIIGTLLISRLDRPLLMKGFESFDSGYKAYLGLLYVDHYHNNPIMRTFIQCLREASQEAHLAAEGIVLKPRRDVEKGDSKPRPAIKKSVRNKWWKFVTLINNPSLVLDAMSERLKKDKTRGIAGELIKADGIQIAPNGRSSMPSEEDVVLKSTSV